MADRLRRIGLAACVVAAAMISSTGSVANADEAGAEGATPANATHYVPLSVPRRVVDSRIGLGTAAAPVPAGGSRDLTIVGAYVPANATAVMVNVTAAGVAGTGFLQVFPTGQDVLGKTCSARPPR